MKGYWAAFLFLFMLACLALSLVEIAAQRWACCARNSQISRDEDDADLEHDNGVRP